jgi:hypothetical protein
MKKIKEVSKHAYLNAIRQSDSWKLLTNELQERIDELGEEILGTFGDNEMKYSKNDFKKLERMLLIQLIALPENMMNALEIIETD